MGVDSVGTPVESFDPVVLARVAGAKARMGIEGCSEGWRRAVEVLGRRGQVSTYVILGMARTARSRPRASSGAVVIGVYRFVVPLLPGPRA
jgi:hypothetical protein